MVDANDAFTVAERYRRTAINNVRSKLITAVVYFNSRCSRTVPSALAEVLVTLCLYYVGLQRKSLLQDKLMSVLCLLNEQLVTSETDCNQYCPTATEKVVVDVSASLNEGLACLMFGRHS